MAMDPIVDYGIFGSGTDRYRRNKNNGFCKKIADIIVIEQIRPVDAPPPRHQTSEPSTVIMLILESAVMLFAWVPRRRGTL
jgi:hypothetical protein